MPIVFGVALGGALGASARYGLDRFIEQRVSSPFPWATFTINVTGCFVIGLLTVTIVERQHLPAWVRVGLVVGVIGGYTTFSTFAQEAFELGEVHQTATAFAYVAASVLVGIAAVYAGTLAGRAL
jgi:CrcB protein